MSKNASGQNAVTEPLRVLLWSPLAGRDPLSGDTSYTEALLASPPPGVVYTTYATALEAGTVRLRARRPRGARELRDGALSFIRAAEIAARRGGLMFREPVWFVEIDGSAFDLVHAHLFALRQVGSAVPVVSSFGFPLDRLYEERDKWSTRRTRRAVFLERFLSRALDVHVPWLNQVAPSIMTSYSEAGLGYLRTHGADPDRLRLIGTALPPAQTVPATARSSTPRHVLFVGRDFERKGGDLALRAVQLLQAEGLDVELTIVTAASAVLPSARSMDATWRLDIHRDEIVSELLPWADLLVMPTRLDGGAPYAVLEALQGSLPVVLSDCVWLDERLSGPAVTRTGLNPKVVANAIRSVLTSATYTEMCADAFRLWNASFSTVGLGAQLATTYADALR